MSIDNLTEKLNKLSLSAEKIGEMTSSHQKLLLDHVKKGDEARMHLKDDIQSEIRLITEKMDKINEANLNMPKLSTPFSHIRSTVKPKEELTHPFITDLCNQDNNQVLMKEAPQLKEWPTFTGEGEYDHMSFIKKIDMLQEDYAIPDELITARLHSPFEKSGKIWYYGIRKTNGKNTWSWWKQEIITKWASESWRYKTEIAFENSFFDPEKDKPLTWFLKQVERFNALYPEMSQKMVHMRILKKCGGELEPALRSRCIEPFSTEEYINALEDIVTRTKIGRTWNKLDIKSPNKQFIKKDKPRKTIKPNTSNNNDQKKFHKFGGIGHLANNCLKKAKINEIVETEDHNDKEEESDSEKDTEESETSESDEINVIHAQINNIDLIYEILDVNSSLPQVGTSDTNLTNIQDAKLYRAKPAKGMGYTAGKLSAIIEHEVDIILNVEKPYPPLLRRPAYPAIPRAREALEVHIKELMDLGVLTKVGHNEQVEVTKPIIITWHNGKSRMVGDFRDLNTYTIPDIYPIPRIHETLTQLSQAKLIPAMDALKGFHKKVLTDNAKKLLRIIVHSGIFEYLRMPFGIKNAPSHYQRMMNTIFPEELSEGWLIIYIDDIIIFSETWDSNLSRIERVLQKIVQVNMKISLKTCHFAYSELKALGHVVSGLSLGIDNNKVAAVLLKSMPQTKK
ncbi:hypothetical protein O181_072802 [Austropuccinia psidii MF-1]|uniref:Reverse transcriptase domain-containing protein n=1 Tax=Austropuccinia psidii MF-1 TaxID=1389203 RepID=A0A9Q3FA28_9BASI|nr:hypothetical protein [Austropuccinia psidii MF-1]